MPEKRNIEELEKEKISRLLFKFSLPAITGMMVQASYNIVDRLFVGRAVGTLGISAITITFPLLIIVIGLGMMIGIGGASLVSIRLGEKKKEEAERIIGTAFVLSLIIGIIIVITVSLFLEPMLVLFGGTDDVLVFAKQYMSIMLIGIIFQQISFSMNNIIRGQGDPKRAMSTMLIGAGLNIALNPLFIFGFGMGIRGSALASVISQFVSCVWVLYYFITPRAYIRLHIKNIRLNKIFVSGILAIGISPLIMQAAGSIINIIINNKLLVYGGDTAIAAMGIGYSLTMMIFMPIFGINQGLQPIVGYNYGAKRYRRVREAFRGAIIAASTICISGFILMMLFAEQIMHLFSGGEQALIDIGTHGLRIFILTLPIVGFQIISTSYFLAVGKPRQSLFLTVSRNGILIIPLLFILPGIFKLDGIWMTIPVSDLFSTSLAVFLIITEFKHLKQSQLKTVAIVRE